MTFVIPGTEAFIQKCDVDAQIAQRTIENLRQELIPLTTLLHAKEYELQIAERTLADIRRSRASAIAANAPVSLIPDDVLGMIFESFLDDWERRTLRPQWNDLRKFLHSISTVSRRWRRVTLSVSRLWRNIYHTDDEGMYDEGTEQYLPFEKSLELCRLSPLHVWAGGTSQIEAVAEHLISLGSSTRVERLTLSFIEWPETINHLLGLDCIDLQALTIIYMESNVDILPLFRGPFASIRCLRLVSCVIPGDLTGSVNLPALEDLIMVACPRKCVEELLSVLSDSNVKYLLIAMTRSRAPVSEGGFVLRCPMQVFSSVRSVTFGGLLSTSEMLSILSITPKLETLHCFHSQLRGSTNPTDYVGLLRALRGAASSVDVLVPKLHTVSFHQSYFSFDALHGLVCHSQRVGTLKSVGLGVPDKARFSHAELQLLAEDVRIYEAAAPEEDELGFL